MELEIQNGHMTSLMTGLLSALINFRVPPVIECHMTCIDLHAHFRRIRPKLQTLQFGFFLLTSVRDDFDVRDYSRQDLFIETGYESELITTINLINSEKGVQK